MTEDKFINKFNIINKRKTSDYGDTQKFLRDIDTLLKESNIDIKRVLSSSEVHNLNTIFVKLFRYCNLRSNIEMGLEIENEPLEDTLLDIAGYTRLLFNELDSNNHKNESTELTKCIGLTE